MRALAEPTPDPALPSPPRAPSGAACARRKRAPTPAGWRVSAALALVLTACGGKEAAPPPPGDAPASAAAALSVPPAPVARDVAVLEVARFGEIRFELLADVAPQTAANFVRLAGEGFFDGTTFHRVIPGFMIQGGDPLSRNRDSRDDGMGRSDPIPDEFSAIGHRRGIVAMANSGRPGSASCQFFVLVADHPELDGGYAIFGNVVAGMDVADRIAATPRDVYGRHGPFDRPTDDVVMKRVRIERAGAAKSAPSAVAP